MVMMVVVMLHEEDEPEIHADLLTHRTKLNLYTGSRFIVAVSANIMKARYTSFCAGLALSLHDRSSCILIYCIQSTNRSWRKHTLPPDRLLLFSRHSQVLFHIISSNVHSPCSQRTNGQCNHSLVGVRRQFHAVDDLPDRIVGVTSHV